MSAKLNHQRKLEALSLAGSVYFVAIDILGPLSKTKASSHFLVNITYGNDKIRRAVPTAKITSRHVTKIFHSD